MEFPVAPLLPLLTYEPGAKLYVGAAQGMQVPSGRAT
jgi:hypothetical protein